MQPRLSIEAARREQALLDQMVAVYRSLRAALAEGSWEQLRELQQKLNEIQVELDVLTRALGPLNERQSDLPEVRAVWADTRSKGEEAVRLCKCLTEEAREASVDVERQLADLSRNGESLAKYRPAQWHSSPPRFTSRSA